MLSKVLVASGLAHAFSDNSFEKIDALVARAKLDPELFAEELRKSEFAAISPTFDSSSGERHASTRKSETALPLVFLHGCLTLSMFIVVYILLGMGDSCFNRGMESITQESGEYLGVYSVCIPTGDTRGEDTLNGIEV